MEYKTLGNLGTILRTVDSVGLKQIILSEKTADAYNPKVVRSTMGAIFRVNVIVVNDIVKTLKEMKKHKFKILATSLETDNNIYDIDYILRGYENIINKCKNSNVRKNRKPKCISCNKRYFV